MHFKMASSQSAQAILEYLLLVLMLAATAALIIRTSNQTLYCLWTGLSRQVARGCVSCFASAAPGANQCP